MAAESPCLASPILAESETLRLHLGEQVWTHWDLERDSCLHQRIQYVNNCWGLVTELPGEASKDCAQSPGPEMGKISTPSCFLKKGLMPNIEWQMGDQYQMQASASCKPAVAARYHGWGCFCKSPLGETACSEQFLAFWHWLVAWSWGNQAQFPGIVSHTQEGRKNACLLQSCKCPALRAGWLLLPDANFTKVGRGVWGVSGEGAFSHYFHHMLTVAQSGRTWRCGLTRRQQWVWVTLWPSTWLWEGSCLCIFLFLPLSSYNHSAPHPISPHIEIQDLKQHFRLPYSEEKPERMAVFSPWTILCYFIIAPAVLKC